MMVEKNLVPKKKNKDLKLLQAWLKEFTRKYKTIDRSFGKRYI